MRYSVLIRSAKDGVLVAFLDSNVINDIACKGNIGYKSFSDERGALDYIRKADARPLNYGVENGKIVQDWGSLDRIRAKNSIVILAELLKEDDSVLGYRCLNISPACADIVNLKAQDIVVREKKLGRPYAQNGIVRNGVVNNYPHKEYLKVSLVKTKEEVESKANRISKADVPQKTSKYTPEQIKVLKMCKRECGGIYTFIKNPELSPEQMYVLYKKRVKGALSVYFANPEIPAEVMKYYGDRLTDKKKVKAYNAMIKHPTLTLEQVKALATGINKGIDYRPVCKPELTANDMIDYINGKDIKLWYSNITKLSKKRIMDRAEQDNKRALSEAKEAVAQ